MHLTDSHTHLYLAQFDEDREEMMERAFQNGIKTICLPNIDSSTIKPLLKLSGQYPQNCFPMMGLHPCSVNKNFEKELEVIGNTLDSKKFYAVGEIGLDYHWDTSFAAQQKEVFKRQIDWAKDRSMPVVIHCRSAYDDILEILEEKNDNKLQGIFHCFTGNREQADKIVDLGNFYLGIGGIVTFKNAGLDKVVKELSLEHIVLETDAPYLTPAPYRGKRNESSFLKYIADKVADLHEIETEEVAKITTRNAYNIFNIENK